MTVSPQMVTPLFIKENPALGWWWQNSSVAPSRESTALKEALLSLCRPVYLIDIGNELAVSHEGSMTWGKDAPPDRYALPLLGFAPALLPENLGDPKFRTFYGLRYAYVIGAMANGISSVSLVETAGRAGLLAFFGAGGLTLSKVDTAIQQLQNSQKRHHFPFGVNLIHSPTDSTLEMETVRLYLQRQVRLVSASAFMEVTLPVTYYRVKGIRQNADGKTVCPNRVIAKVSREEVARQFLNPPPQKHIEELLNSRLITAGEAELAQQVPMADDLTAEADSGGHTDNRPALALLPTMMALRDKVAKYYNYQRTPCVGLGGGIATPASTAAAFAMGAAFVLTGSVNQGCIEADTSATTRHMLAATRQADVIMAPSADMFELGVKVQVVKRGTLFPLRARKLYDLYTRYDCYEDIPCDDRKQIERDLFKKSFEEEWEATQLFFTERDPRQIERARHSPKHRMALVFRSYLGQSSTWANNGEPNRQLDYQIWCGPAMGAFNEWTQGSFLEDVGNRSITTVAYNFLFGAAVINRFQHLRNQGVPLPAELGTFHPLRVAQIQKRLKEKNYDMAQ